MVQRTQIGANFSRRTSLRHLRLLVVEDSADDLLLMVEQLAHAGYRVEYRQVLDAEGLRAALQQERWDFVISDHGLPEFDAIAALELTRALQPDTPFIVVSGHIDEALAIESMRNGSCDYVFKDRMERLAAVIERELRNACRNTHDVLTGLLNRYGFRDALEVHKKAARSQGLALIMLDIDRFRTINEGLGFARADQLLRTIAERLRSCFQDAVVARLGGDEFALLVSGVESCPSAEEWLRQCFALFSDPFVVDGQPLRVTASLGLSILHQDAEGVYDLLSNAERAMYNAKNRGGDGFCRFDQEMVSSALEAIRIEHDLHDALHRGQLHVAYQPQVRVRDGRLIGVEALLRWTHPQFGPISPAQFIPVAESSGLIVEIGRWVLQESCAQVAKWQAAGLGELRVAVNLSARQFRDGGILGDVQEVLRTTGLTPAQLELEITEGTLMESTRHSASILESLRAIGVSIAVDDFGTGYSSLAYIKRFPLDALKIDQSFVADLADNDHDALVDAIIALARSLQLRTVAEGVEGRAQHCRLHRMGCDEAQGYLYDRPLGAAAMESRLQRRARGERVWPIA